MLHFYFPWPPSVYYPTLTLLASHFTDCFQLFRYAYGREVELTALMRMLWSFGLAWGVIY